MDKGIDEKKKSKFWSLDLDPIPIFKLEEKVATITIGSDICSNYKVWVRMSYFCWCYFVNSLKGGSSNKVSSINDHDFLLLLLIGSPEKCSELLKANDYRERIN